MSIAPETFFKRGDKQKDSTFLNHQKITRLSPRPKNLQFQFRQKQLIPVSNLSRVFPESSNLKVQENLNEINVEPEKDKFPSHSMEDRESKINYKKIYRKSFNQQKKINENLLSQVSVNSSKVINHKKTFTLDKQLLYFNLEENNLQINNQQNLLIKQSEKRLTCFLIKTKIQQLLQSIPFQILITLLTICSLFMQDIRTIFIEKENDRIVDYLNIFFLLAFSIEILMSLTVEKYAFSFFFYLDIISTFSILLDVTIFTNIIYSDGDSNQQINILVSQTKASRVAARAVRIMKIFRLARVVKLYKSAVKTKELNQLKQKQLLKKKIKEKKTRNKNGAEDMNQNFDGETEYKLSFNNLSVRDKAFTNSSKSILSNTANIQRSNCLKKSLLKRQKSAAQIDKIHQQPLKQSRSEKKQNNEQRQLNETQQFQDEIQTTTNNPLQLNKKESNISKILSDSTIKKIIIVILIIMLSMTALDSNYYYPENTSWDFLTLHISKLLLQSHVSINFINSVIINHLSYFETLDIESEVIAFETPFKQLYSKRTADKNDLRITQIGFSQTTFNITEVMIIRPDLTLESYNDSIQLDSITVVLSYKSYNSIDSWFSIGKIIFICLTIIYLLQSFNKNSSKLILIPIQNMLDAIINPDKNIQQDEEDNHEFKEARYETLIVQRAIIKIRGLMSTIFGKIGMDLVYNQLFKLQNLTAANYLSVKKKSYCIYGICKIQNFVEISQTLQDDTFTFINQIAEIVHSSVYRYGGYGVKNLPDGFLVAFKLPEDRQKQILDEAERCRYSKQKKNTYLNILCDFSIYSMVKIIVRLCKQPKLLFYKKDQRILQRFGNNFQIEMNLSIGMGQSFEGMIGSEFKIDPTYLGGIIDQIWKISSIALKYPNLILMQKQLYENLSVGLKNHCRIMEKVKLSYDAEENTEIYAVDLDLQYISPSRSKAEKYKMKQEQLDIHLKKQLNMEILKNSTQISNYQAETFINSKKQLREVLKKTISDDMRKKYQIAYKTYNSGDWVEAKQYFEEIMRVIKEDILSKRIYNIMAKEKFKFTDNIQKYIE